MTLRLERLEAHLPNAANAAALTFGSVTAGNVVPVDDPTPALPDGTVRLVRAPVVEGGLELVLALTDTFAKTACEAMGTDDLGDAFGPVLQSAAGELAMLGDTAVDLAGTFEVPMGEPWGPAGTRTFTAGLFLGDEHGEQVGNLIFLFIPEGATGADGLASVSTMSSAGGLGDRTHAPQGDLAVATFTDLGGGEALSGAAHPLALLRGVEMKVTAELGRTKLPVSSLLDLGPGSIVELDRVAGMPVDVLVNGTIIAHGEVVVIDEEYGVRITDILGLEDVR